MTKKHNANFLIRLKRILFELLSFLFSIFTYILVILHWVIIGQIYTKDFIMEALSDEHVKKIERMKKPPEEPDTINFSGYKVRIWTLASYCLTNFIFYFLFHYHYIQNIPSVFRGVFANNFLILCYTILSIIIYHELIPKILRFFIDLLTTININKIKKIF